MPTITVEFQPTGRRIDIEHGETLLHTAQLAGTDLVAACSGIGICGTCLVRVVSGETTLPTLSELDLLDSEKIKAGYRLACQCIPLSDTRVEVPPESLPAGQKLQLEGWGGEIKLVPAISAIDLFLSPPTLHDLKSDYTRLKDALKQLGLKDLSADYQVLTSMSERIRNQNWSLRVAIRSSTETGQIVNILPANSGIFGLAVDIGSTKLAIYLVNLETGATVAQKGVANPQISFGEDVISRIAFANKGIKNRELLQKRLIEILNQSIIELCQSSNCTPEQIVEAVLVGNTAIHHLVTFLPVQQLGAAPYVAAISDPLELRARDLGLNIAPGALVYFPAIIAGYVGADHTSALLATRFSQSNRIRVLIDIGTNTEISLGIGEKIYSCSTASGPAFEGAHIHDGMRAAPGAIEKVQLTSEQCKVVTVGGIPPVGICGTGVLQAISELLRNEIITPQGTLRKNCPGVRFQDGRGGEYLLVPAAQTGHGRDIVITRKDINEIQLAKGAIRAGIEILLSHGGISSEEVEEWVIAGAFGTYLNLESAIQIGMFPKVPLDRFHQVGNAAGTGAKQMLLSLDERSAATQITQRVEYIELTIYPDFTQQFVKHMNFDIE
ncbi:MAG: DUF4445 domain-containing protein [Anaerolineae bacterium]|nr:DUF4445 domain-containing protein [Anaerolineae bacterium]